MGALEEPEEELEPLESAYVFEALDDEVFDEADSKAEGSDIEPAADVNASKLNSCIACAEVSVVDGEEVE